MVKKWYSVLDAECGDAGNMDVRYLEEEETFSDTHAECKNFTEAKEQAIKAMRGDIKSLQHAIKYLQKTKKKDITG